MAIANDPASTGIHEDRCDKLAWLHQATRAREAVFGLFRLKLAENVDTGDAEGRDKAACESAASLTERYLVETEKLFALTNALVRTGSELG